MTQKRVVVSITEKLYIKIKLEAINQNKTLSEYLREIIEKENITLQNKEN